ncbi:putative protein of unknown function (DUF4602) [Monocercomonoides exilis]|uniref:putative protein of unknown function (DUF4602) n=1 Tax=Monocercomonoides exilis TaxID=2049356 RepID=UPI003559F1CE|nr:putative protein of unknown function (DUF4602) [Monocercomonoides exilis]|eukprot:MONOS_13960.1-p1 / transcript=MONOS_13960.1 / gene=MONOS_13960 / organism=Monocercomonoides_exilis_PA203 / gene_product=unspecified product / transcript_product=unspecified product / location=Mono_scaffold00912:641-1425(-) / protein_length=202 / sequence_SO=supercontig / SO=protein_coding / is_pseudo=false
MDFDDASPPVVVDSPFVERPSARRPLKPIIGKTQNKFEKQKIDAVKHKKEEEMFVSTRRIIKELGGLGLKGRERIEWENKRRKERGGLPRPNPKVPYKILKGMIKMQQKRQEKAIKEAIEQGVKPPKKKLTSTKLAEKDRGRVGKDPTGRGLNPSVGRFKNGVLLIKKDVIEKTNKSEKDVSRKAKIERNRKGKNKGKKRWK